MIRAGLLASLSLAALSANIAMAGMIGVQAPVIVERLHNVGGLLYDRLGNRVQLRGFNVDNDSIGLEIDDATKAKAMGANVERWTPAWYQDKNGTCSFPEDRDAYNPPPADGGSGNDANGYFRNDASPNNILDQTDAVVRAATSRKIWVILGFTTGGCDFTTINQGLWNGGQNANTTIQSRYFKMLEFFVKRYRYTPYIACYELWTEPTPLTADPNSRYRNDIVANIEIQAIVQHIRLYDQVTPICIGPAANYDIRDNFAMIGPFNPVLGSNVWNMNDWYELAGAAYSTFTGYTHQLKPIDNNTPPPLQGANFTGHVSQTTLYVDSGLSGLTSPGANLNAAGATHRGDIAYGTSIASCNAQSTTCALNGPSQNVPSETMFTGYTTYPDQYWDIRVNQAYVAGVAPVCTYPPFNGTDPELVQMDAAFLSGVDDACAVAWTNQVGVPILMEQIGIPTSTPGAYKYDSDQLDMMNARHQSYMIWLLRNGYHLNSPNDGQNLGASGSQGLYYGDPSGGWHVKDAGYVCSALDQGNANYNNKESKSTCDDYYDMFKGKFGAPL